MKEELGEILKSNNSLGFPLMKDRFYLIGSGITPDEVPVYLAVTYTEGTEPVLFVQINRGPASENWELLGKEAITSAPQTAKFAPVDDHVRLIGVEQEPRGWLARKCDETSSGWFMPLAKRMAAGEHVPLHEIQAAYFAQNGRPMPYGKWSELF